jgi:hypothetical protein
VATYPSRKDLKELFEPSTEIVSVKKLNALVELRLGPKGRYVRLTPTKARMLGNALIGTAEEIDPTKREFIPCRS